MKHGRSKILIAILCLLLTLSGCAAKEAAGKSTDLMKGTQAAQQATGGLPEKNVCKDINRFSADLFKAAAGNPGNIMISPASVYLALAMTLNGADGETKTQMLKTLADQGVTLDMINKASRDWLGLLAKTGSKTTLGIANSIWFDQAFIPDKAFLQRNADFFNAGARKLDFRDAGTPGAINSWVKEATQGTIDKVVESIDPNVVMVLINTVYFKSDWQTTFDKNETRSQTFHTPQGAIESAFLHRTGKMTYFSGYNAAGVALPYDDGHFAYFALIPDGETTPREWIAKQDPVLLMENIAGMMAQKSDFTVELAMPRFESRYEDSLKNELTQLGMEIAFDPDRADFSLMNEAHEKNLYISEVKHKTFVRIDEKGTEASAATSVEVGTTSMPMSDKQLTFDRPFIYGIMDSNLGMPLFLGIMEDPTVQ